VTTFVQDWFGKICIQTSVNSGSKRGTRPPVSYLAVYVPLGNHPGYNICSFYRSIQDTQRNGFNGATLCYSAVYAVALFAVSLLVCLSVCLSQVRLLSKRLKFHHANNAAVQPRTQVFNFSDDKDFVKFQYDRLYD